MKYLVRLVLTWLARAIIKRYRPMVVGIAGSVGKTGTKDVVAAAVTSPKRSVRATTGNFNAEIGVPVTIIAGGARPTSIFGWLRIIGRGFRSLLIRESYPGAVVLEMATDKPGDLASLLHIAPPTVGVLTSTAPEHLEFFGDEATVVAEESLIVRQLPPNGTAIINIDDERNAALVDQIRATVITYGWQERAMIRADGSTFTTDAQGRVSGMVAKIAVDGSVIPVALPGVLGKHQVLPILAGVAVATALGDSVAAVVPRLSTYRPPAGRMRLFPGVNGSLIIDDSYNASPEAVQAAIETLLTLPATGKKYAILGQMSELGSSSDHWHAEIGRLFGPKTVARLVTVGPVAAGYGPAAEAVGFPPVRITNVADAEMAAGVVRPDLGPGDVVLIKGSRYAARLERAVRLLLENPERDSASLVGAE